MHSKTITARAPTRIDLCGGTLDIWPLYLFLKNPLTLNLAIDLIAEAKLEFLTGTSGRGNVRLESIDQKKIFETSWDSLALTEGLLEAPPELTLHIKLLRHFAFESKYARAELRQGNLILSTLAKSPAGAGLGGSSALSVALVGALATWALGPTDFKLQGERFIEIVRDVETTVIQVPAGLQDYYAAMYGGLQGLHWGAGAHRREELPTPLAACVADRLLLFYSGQSRNSGINNWVLFKNLIDRQAGLPDRFQKIADATQRLKKSILDQDWTGAASAIADEWKSRRTLAAGISTPAMDQAVALCGKQGIESYKICGAGGGGCFFVFVPDANAEIKRSLQTEIGALGITPLPFHQSSDGLKVTWQ